MFSNPILNNLVNKYREKKLSHAYLIETNDIELLMNDIKILIKNICCEEEYQESCTKCNLCNLIMKNNLPSIKIIEPDGTSIKKVQIEELKEKFATIPVYSKYNIYIIKEAEKLNASSANSMLKFLEEPEEGIIGFFLTKNKDIMIDTIKSRCQSLVVNYDETDITKTLNITDEELNGYKEVIKKYLKKINSHEVINNKKEILAIYSERKDIINIFSLIFEIYYQNFLKSRNLEYQRDIADIYITSEKETKMIEKLNIITSIVNNLSYNVSIEQTLDKFVIEMRGCNE